MVISWLDGHEKTNPIYDRSGSRVQSSAAKATKGLVEKTNPILKHALRVGERVRNDKHRESAFAFTIGPSAALRTRVLPRRNGIDGVLGGLR